MYLNFWTRIIRCFAWVHKVLRTHHGWILHRYLKILENIQAFARSSLRMLLHALCVPQFAHTLRERMCSPDQMRVYSTNWVLWFWLHNTVFSYKLIQISPQQNVVIIQYWAYFLLKVKKNCSPVLMITFPEILFENTCPDLEMNCRPQDIQSDALPNELSEHVGSIL